MQEGPTRDDMESGIQGGQVLEERGAKSSVWMNEWMNDDERMNGWMDGQFNVAKLS